MKKIFFFALFFLLSCGSESVQSENTSPVPDISTTVTTSTTTSTTTTLAASIPLIPEAYPLPASSGELAVSRSGEKLWFTYLSNMQYYVYCGGETAGPFERFKFPGRVMVEDDTAWYYFESNSQKFVQVEDTLYGGFISYQTPVFTNGGYSFTALSDDGSYLITSSGVYGPFSALGSVFLTNNHAVYSAQKDGAWYACLDNVENGSYETLLSPLVWTSNGLIIPFKKGGSVYLQYPDETAGPFDSVTCVGENSYGYQSGGDWFALAGETRYGSFDYLESLTVTGNESFIKYQKDDSQFFHSAFTTYGPFDSLSVLNEEKPLLLSYTLSNENFIQCGTNIYGPFDSVGTVFALSGTHYAVSAVLGSTNGVLHNGEWLALPGESKTLEFDPDENLAVIGADFVLYGETLLTGLSNITLASPFFTESGSAFSAESGGKMTVYENFTAGKSFSGVWDLSTIGETLVYRAQENTTNTFFIGETCVLSNFYWADVPASLGGKIYVEFIDAEGKKAYLDGNIYGPFDKLVHTEELFTGLSDSTAWIYRVTNETE